MIDKLKRLIFDMEADIELWEQHGDFQYSDKLKPYYFSLKNIINRYGPVNRK